MNVDLTEDEIKRIVADRLYSLVHKLDPQRRTFVIDWQRALQTVHEDGIDRAVDEIWEDSERFEERILAGHAQILDINCNTGFRISL